MRYTFAQKYASLSLVIMPLFACYNLFGTSMAKYLMLLSCIILISFGKQTYYIPQKYKWFIVYAFSIPQVVALITSNTSHFIGSYITLGLFSANLCLAIPFLEKRLLMKYYKAVVYFTVFIFALQELSFILLGHRFSGLLPFFTLYNDVPAAQYATTLINAPRSSSIFVEPSHYAQYLAPFLALSLYGLYDKRKFINKESIIVTVVFLIMRSGNGIFLCASIWGVHLLIANIGKFKKFLLVIPLSLFVAYQGYTVFSQTEQGAALLDRQEELSSDYDRTDSSGTIRIFRGFFVQEEMTPFTKIFGVGQGGANDIIDHSSVKWMFFNEHYLNNASGFLISYGYIGTLLFLLFLFSQYNKQNKGSLMLIVAFIVLCFIESFMCDSRMLLYTSLICMMSDNVSKPVAITGKRVSNVALENK